MGGESGRKGGREKDDDTCYEWAFEVESEDDAGWRGKKGRVLLPL
jgi:hypothetical protein